MAVDTEWEASTKREIEKLRAKEIARQVRVLRREKNWSQETLAKHAGVHRNTIWRMETNPELVPLRSLARIGAALGIPDWKILRCADDILNAA